ncbi:MAG TPA: hypothetical protein VGX93_04985 [Chthoniobacterales bacterium]|nr:hypothetical protein [Chthoniobacterales bacterium]
MPDPFLSEIRRYGTDFFKDSAQLEQFVFKKLDDDFRFSVLERVAVFAPSHLDSSPYAYEIDHLLHYREKGIDYLTLIECKILPVEPKNTQWLAHYEGGPKDVKAQVLNQASALKSYLQPIPKATELRMNCLVFSLKIGEDIEIVEQLPDGYEVRLCGVQKFTAYLDDLKKRIASGDCTLVKVNQSEVLGLLRLGAPVKSLGHPEIANALRYVERCRRRLDSELRNQFSPTTNRWAINGTAGMGKSVLLAYSACVLASDRELVASKTGYQLRSFKDKAAQCAIPPLEKRRMVIYSMRRKQLEVLEKLYQDFQNQFRDADNEEVRMIKPTFRVWSDREAIPEETNLLLIDESHDLPLHGQKKLAEWHGAERYLVVAVDRHQKLRLAGPAAKILEGLDFSGRTRRLRRIYRNPTPIYMAGLGIMFRWFSDDSGPKVIPSIDELKDEFGLDVFNNPAKSGDLHLKIRDDSHPANSWTNTVGEFKSASVAYSRLEGMGLRRDEILWVRFCKEDPEFSYEMLSQFTYHNLHSGEGPDLVDKYIKGQDFFIVVIEGFSDLINKGIDKADQQPAKPEERAMWSLRREIYLCCSRATGFLYFIHNVPQTDPQKFFRRELTALVGQLSTPRGGLSSSGNRWEVVIKKSSLTRTMANFLEWPIESKPPVPPARMESKPSVPLASMKSKLPVPTVPMKSKPSVPLAPIESKLPVPKAPIRPSVSQIPLQKALLVTPTSLARHVGMKPYEIIEMLTESRRDSPGINDRISMEDLEWLAKEIDFGAETLETLESD